MEAIDLRAHASGKFERDMLAGMGLLIETDARSPVFVRFWMMPVPDRFGRYAVNRNDGFQLRRTLRNSG